MSGPLHVRGVFLPDETERDLYVLDGRLTFEPVSGAETVAGAGWVVPGLVDAHCHIGLGPGGGLHEVEDLREQARAHGLGVRVAVHTFGEEALPDLIDAGVDSIEHGTGLTPDLIGRMVERGTALVPTLVNIDNFPAIADQAAEKFPAYAARIRRLHSRARARLR